MRVVDLLNVLSRFEGEKNVSILAKGVVKVDGVTIAKGGNVVECEKGVKGFVQVGARAAADDDDDDDDDDEAGDDDDDD